MMINCQEFRERLDDIALSDPTSQLDDVLNSHLQCCVNCQNELHKRQEEWLTLSANLTISQKDVSRVESRVFASVNLGPLAPSSSWLDSYLRNASFWSYVLAVSVLIGLVSAAIFSLSRSDTDMTRTDQRLIREFAERMRRLDELDVRFSDPQLQYVVFKSADLSANPAGYLVHDSDSSEIHFFGFNLEPLTNKTYRIWLVNPVGDVVDSTDIVVNERNVGTAIIPFRGDFKRIHEAIVTIEESDSPALPSKEIRMRTSVND